MISLYLPVIGARSKPAYVTGPYGTIVAVNVPAPALLFWIAEIERRFGETPCVHWTVAE